MIRKMLSPTSCSIRVPARPRPLPPYKVRRAVPLDHRERLVRPVQYFRNLQVRNRQPIEPLHQDLPPVLQKRQNLLQGELFVRPHVVARIVLDQGLIQVQLLRTPVRQPLLHGPLGEQAVHRDRAVLPYTVRAVHRLRVDVRVPVLVVDHDEVRGLEIDPNPPRPRGHQVHKVVAVVDRIKLLHVELPHDFVCGPVQPQVLPPAPLAVGLELVEDHLELGEKNHLVRLVLLF
mmetsp:Transcript_26828/g.67577  ORF Transcript_26828/g.67577 Transcript_26828/m.67577 type:complete len:232 (+) Transcript_26828:114-809(+)